MHLSLIFAAFCAMKVFGSDAWMGAADSFAIAHFSDTVSTFLLGALLANPLTPIFTKYRPHKVIQALLLLFMASSLLLAISDSSSMALLARICQGLSCGANMAIARSLLSTNGNAQANLAQLNALYCIAPLALPFASAMLVEHMGWRWLAYVTAAAALVVFSSSRHLPGLHWPSNPRPLNLLQLHTTGCRASDQAAWAHIFLTSTFLFVLLQAPAYLGSFGIASTNYWPYFAASSIGCIAGSSQKSHIYGLELAALGAVIAPFAPFVGLFLMGWGWGIASPILMGSVLALTGVQGASRNALHEALALLVLASINWGAFTLWLPLILGLLAIWLGRKSKTI